MATAYSGTPLAKKLGIKAGHSILLHNQPDHYFDLFADLPANLTFLKRKNQESADFIHLFCTRFADLQQITTSYKKALKKDGLLWLSWPKGSSAIETDLKRDMIRDHLLAAGLVDVKVAAIDKDWSGLKFVYRLKDR